MSIRIIKSLADLRPFGFDILTGEACGIGYRILTDLDYNAYKIYCACRGLESYEPHGTVKGRSTCGKFADRNGNYFDVPPGFEDPWNQGVCSVMLCPDEWIELGIFAMLRQGGYDRVDLYERWPSIPSLQRQQQRQEYLSDQINNLGLEHGDYEKLPYEVLVTSPQRSYSEKFLIGCMRDEYDTDEHRVLRIACDRLRGFTRSSAPGTGLRNEHQMTGRVT